MSGQKVIPVILCGGSGTRLWPRSRPSKPKPFLPLVGEGSLFQQALLRCTDETLFGAPIVVTGERILDHVEAQLDQGHRAEIIVEPEPKNTAAAIAIAARRLPDDAIMLVCPSDHYIDDSDTFRLEVQKAARLAQAGWLVSLGMRPTRPDTGFGYLRKGEAIPDGGFQVGEFVEKPDVERARLFLASADYWWNGGIFTFGVRQFLDELERHRPAIAEAVGEAADKGSVDGHRFYPESAAYGRIRPESVDYAVMENTALAAMVPVDFEWSDIGNWAALRDACDRDEMGNAVKGPAEIIDCHDVLIDTDGPKVHAVGLQNVLIVVDGNDILVIGGERAQQVSKLTGALAP